MRVKFRIVPLIAGVAAVLFVAQCSQPCRASILKSGREALTRAPEARFSNDLEIQRLVARDAADHETPDTVEADLKEFATAVAGATNQAELVSQFKSLREQIANARRAREEQSNATPGPVAVDLPGAPAEFVLYLKGAALWHEGAKDAACKPWNELLELPAADRHYRSTWAAYMLGRRYVDSNHRRAHKNFELVQRLAADGFADSTDLADASWGWDAQVYLRDGEYNQAIHSYLRQRDPALSLRMAAAKAVDGANGSDLADLAVDEKCRGIITSFLVSGGVMRPDSWVEESSPDTHEQRFPKWAAAVQAAGAQDETLSTRMALAAYQQKDFDEAQTWLGSAGSSLTARWLRARLAFENGQVEQAAGTLRILAKELPGNDDALSTDLLGALSCGNTSARQQIFRELGAFELNQKHFAAAIDAFIRGDSWGDAAFVAERVLTLEELQNYVDALVMPAPGGHELRELLARRLMRLNEMAAAHPYFSTANQEKLDQLRADLAAGLNENAPAEERAASYFAAARMMRQSGMELMGTELEPDWAVDHGMTESDPYGEARLKTEADSLPPSAEELDRLKASELVFRQRFRYRYIAAELGWFAARLMPNNSDATARVLCESGSWIKVSDPKRADKFYKALVRRCGKTEIGKRADTLRWFPDLDEGGNLRQRPAEIIQTSYTEESANFQTPDAN